jgi:hypothetical protein
MSVFREMTLDAGLRGEEARQMEAQLEQEAMNEHFRALEAERDAALEAEFLESQALPF